MSASLQAYEQLINEFYSKKVRQCQRPNGLEPCLGMNLNCICVAMFEQLCSIAQTNVPFKFRYASTTKFSVEDDTEAKRRVEKYIYNIEEMNRQGFGMWVSGSHHSGKTLLICSVLVAAAKKKIPAYYLDINEFYRLQEIRYSDDSDKYQTKIKKLQSIDFLAIDGIGFGIQGGKPASKMALAALFQERSAAKKPTIVGSLAINEKDRHMHQELSMICPEFYPMVADACPVLIGLIGGQEYMEGEIAKKKNIFDSLPEPEQE